MTTAWQLLGKVKKKCVFVVTSILLVNLILM